MEPVSRLPGAVARHVLGQGPAKENVDGLKPTAHSQHRLPRGGKFLQQPAILNFVTPDGGEDRETAEKLKAAFEAEKYTLNPNTEKRSNFANFYNDLVFQVANTGEVNKLLYEYQLDTQEETGFAREQVLGVSSDEELQFMIRFQNAYNVASRYINTLNSMLESMINQFGA